MKNTTPLTWADLCELARHPKAASQSLQAYYNMGRALKQIRDEKLYREECESFERFCTERYGLDMELVSLAIEASDIATN